MVCSSNNMEELALLNFLRCLKKEGYGRRDRKKLKGGENCKGKIRGKKREKRKKGNRKSWKRIKGKKG